MNVPHILAGALSAILLWGLAAFITLEIRAAWPRLSRILKGN